MKNTFLAALIFSLSLLSFPVFSQTESETELLGLPGDNLDLFAVLDLFQKSKTIEDFEKSLNEEKTGINNLDLNLDNKVDFIKVVTKQEDNDFTFILQVDVTDKETQDVAVILLSKDKNDKVTMQIVGDVDLYGKDYVIEPKPPVTVNPGYIGNKTDTVKVDAPTTVVVVESAPIVQYVYSPVYVPYYPPYYYAYYPPYFRAFTIVAIGVYRHNNYYHHGGYHGGGYGNTVVVHNTNNFNNYNNSRNRSNTVNHNKANGNYNRNNNSNNRNNVSNNKSNVSNNRNNVSNNKSNVSNNRNNVSNNKSNVSNNKSNFSGNRNNTSNNMTKGTSQTRKSTTNQTMGSSRTRSGGNFSGGSRGGGGGRRR